MSFYRTTPDLSKKENAQKAHAIKRAKERFGINVDLDRINRMVKNGDCEAGYIRFVGRQNNRLTKHKIMYDNTEMIVIYDKARKTVITFLYTPQQLEEQRKQQSLHLVGN